MTQTFKIGIAGLGTVGAGLISLIQKNADLITARSGKVIEITSICARDKTKDRGVDLSGYQWVDNPEDLLNQNIDCVVELIGGEDGIAKTLIENALAKGIDVVTANKALLAHHGASLAALAEDNNAGLAYEAAVAGAIPVIKTLREGLAGNQITRLYGILNGTCNYILTEMRETGRAYEDVLKDAQDLGYAEADPAFDVGGIDAAHKLCLLTSLAFGVTPDFEKLDVSGIADIQATDISYAQDLGYKIKLIGSAAMIDGQIAQSVGPGLVRNDSPLGSVEGVFNAVYIEGDQAGPIMIEGRGAGAGPTASAVMGDIIDLAQGKRMPVFGITSAALTPLNTADASTQKSRFYLRLNVPDQPGVIAQISATLQTHNISIESLSQQGGTENQPVDVVMITHACSLSQMRQAVDALKALHMTQVDPVLLPLQEM